MDVYRGRLCDSLESGTCETGNKPQNVNCTARNSPRTDSVPAHFVATLGHMCDPCDTLSPQGPPRQSFPCMTAALRVARRLNGLWPLCYIFVVVPRPIRDALYKLVARNRYKWFGKKDACMMPTPEVRARFLQV